MDIEIFKFPGDLYEPTKWAVNQLSRKIPPEFEEWILGLMPEPCREVVGHFVNVHTPESATNGEWVRGYPHCHTWSVNWPPDVYTCVVFLAMADEGGEFGLGGNSPDDPYEIFKPEIGTAISFDAMRWHGVRAVTRGTRISLLTSGFPDWEEHKKRRLEDERSGRTGANYCGGRVGAHRA